MTCISLRSQLMLLSLGGLTVLHLIGCQSKSKKNADPAVALQLAVSKYPKLEVERILGPPDFTQVNLAGWNCQFTNAYYCGEYKSSSVFFGFDKEGKFERYYYSP